jgi:hypothetical protein
MRALGKIIAIFLFLVSLSVAGGVWAQTGPGGPGGGNGGGPAGGQPGPGTNEGAGGQQQDEANANASESTASSALGSTSSNANATNSQAAAATSTNTSQGSYTADTNFQTANTQPADTLCAPGTGATNCVTPNPPQNDDGTSFYAP